MEDNNKKSEELQPADVNNEIVEVTQPRDEKIDGKEEINTETGALERDDTPEITVPNNAKLKKIINHPVTIIISTILTALLIFNWNSISSEDKDFRNVNWGTSKTEVETLEELKLTTEVEQIQCYQLEKSADFYGLNQYDFTIRDDRPLLMYEFNESNILFQALYTVFPDKPSEAFVAVGRHLQNEYGLPDEGTGIWATGNVLLKTWHTEESVIQLALVLPDGMVAVRYYEPTYYEEAFGELNQ